MEGGGIVSRDGKDYLVSLGNPGQWQLNGQRVMLNPDDDHRGWWYTPSAEISSWTQIGPGQDAAIALVGASYIVTPFKEDAYEPFTTLAANPLYGPPQGTRLLIPAIAHLSPNGGVFTVLDWCYSCTSSPILTVDVFMGSRSVLSPDVIYPYNDVLGIVVSGPVESEVTYGNKR